MKLNLSTLAKTTLSGVAITATLGCLASSADALTLASSSGSWGSAVGGINVTDQTVAVGFGNGTENQVRWGISVGSGQSGLGFTGVGLTNFEIDQIFEVGTLRHFNTPISGGTGADSVPLNIALSLSDPLINQTFDFNFVIDETSNVPPCQFASDPGNPCSDKISFSNAVSSSNFMIDGTKYTLELLGFRDTPAGTPVNAFISQEGSTNSATLFAKITTPPSEKVPEPTAMVGLGLLGLYIMGRRNQKHKLH